MTDVNVYSKKKDDDMNQFFSDDDDPTDEFGKFVFRLGLIIFNQYSTSIPPENTWKPEVFWCFQGV